MTVKHTFIVKPLVLPKEFEYVLNDSSENMWIDNNNEKYLEK